MRRSGRIDRTWVSLVSLSTLGLLHPNSKFRGFRQALADVTAAEADVLEFPIAELTEGKKLCLALVARDCGGNPAVDKAAEARKQDTEPSSDYRRGRYVAWGDVKHCHVDFLRKARAPGALPSLESRQRAVPCEDNDSMHLAAEKDFQRTAIYSRDAHEMRLIKPLAVRIALCRRDPRHLKARRGLVTESIRSQALKAARPGASLRNGR
jgi:hypothetical protein